MAARETGGERRQRDIAGEKNGEMDGERQTAAGEEVVERQRLERRRWRVGGWRGGGEGPTTREKAVEGRRLERRRWRADGWRRGGGETGRLFEAARLGSVEALLEVLLDDPLILERALELNQDGFSPIRITAINGDIELARELLKIDSSLCSLKDRDERTPIHLVAMKGRLDVMGELLSACPESAGETVELLLNNKSERMVEVNAKNLNNLIAMDQSSCDEDGKSQFRNQNVHHGAGEAVMASRIGKLFFPLLCFLLVYVGSLLIRIEPWTFVQQLGEAVFIPAGCPHQVRNLKHFQRVVGGGAGDRVGHMVVFSERGTRGAEEKEVEGKVIERGRDVKMVYKWDRDYGLFFINTFTSTAVAVDCHYHRCLSPTVVDRCRHLLLQRALSLAWRRRMVNLPPSLPRQIKLREAARLDLARREGDGDHPLCQRERKEGEDGRWRWWMIMHSATDDDGGRGGSDK
ncbi:hypothetical protein Syun_015210 [Stephania yunnanensis]|uniref:JmjC domain-containing protein n=1 Tax=Stephania yunnanensis TaxID=152371 RepID=A0AAP0PCP0_9MAGN